MNKLSESLKKVRQDVEIRFSELSEEQRRKIVGYVYISLTLFTFSFFGIFAIAPTLSTVANLNKQYEDNKLVLDALNKKLTNLQLLDFQYQEIQPDLPTIYTAIPRTPQIPYLTRQLENLADDNNVVVTRLNFGTVEVFPNIKPEPIYSYTFSVAVYGSQTEVNNFIGDIINFDRIVGVERIITGLNDDNQYATTITGRAFFSDK